jgi:hypothetical protein
MGNEGRPAASQPGAVLLFIPEEEEVGLGNGAMYPFGFTDPGPAGCLTFSL